MNPDKAKFWDQFKASGELVVCAFANHLCQAIRNVWDREGQISTVSTSVASRVPCLF